MYIVTTTISAPTKATKRFCLLAFQNNWKFVIVGDTKTPHDQYRVLENEYKNNVRYLHPEDQEKLFPELSKILGWKTIQRRNIGFAYAYKRGAEIIASVDDDNIPYDNWGQDLIVGKKVMIDVYKPKYTSVFDPFSVTNHKELWHRGFPIQELALKNEIDYLGKQYRFIGVQADFWDGDPDLDAICRLTKKPLVKFDKFEPFTGYPHASPFNSQNTFVHRSMFPKYSVWPGVGRMDDIWAGYYAQATVEEKAIAYCSASVYQERNPQDLVTNLENECLGYRHTHGIASCLWHAEYDCIPDITREFIKEYEKHFDT